MKAPTADYSSLSQALSAKNSAIQTSYSAKDASNWKSSYDIQQKSFQLSRESLDMQKEQTNVSGALNMVNGAVNLLDKSASLYNAIYTAKQDDIGQELTRKSTEMSSQWENLVQLNGDYMTEITDPVTGGTTLSLSKKGQEAFDNLMAQYFPDDTNYGWGMDKKVDNMKQNLRVTCMSYAQSIALNNIKGDADNNYAYNLEYATQVDLNSGEEAEEPVYADDGTGNMRKLHLGKRQKLLIDSRAAAAGWSQERIYAEYIKAAQDLSDRRKTYLTDDLTIGFTNGTYISSAEDREKAYSSMNTYLETIEDPVEREKTRQNFETAITAGVSSYFDNEYNTIIDKNNKPYEAMREVYQTDLNKEGKYYSLFFDEDGNPNPYITPSTYTSVKKKFKSYITAAEETGGTMQTDYVNSEFTAAKQKWKAGQYKSSKDFGAEVERIMSEVYGDNWRVGSRASEAWSVYTNNLKEYIPEDIMSDPEFENVWETTWKTALDADNIDYDDLDADSKTRASEIKYEMSNKILSYVLNHPSAIVDKGEFIDALKTISSVYSKEWADFVSFNVNKVTTWDSLTGGELKNKFNSKMNEFVNLYSADFEGDITSEGYYNRSESNLAMDVNDTVSDAIIALGNNLNAEGAEISDTALADIKFRMNDDGTLYKEDGKPVIESIVWNGILNGTETDIVYDFASKSWKKNVTGNNADNTVIEEQERKEAEDTLAGGKQIEIIDNFLEDNSSPQYDELISFLQDNCINEDEFDATLTILYNRYKEGTFMPAETMADYEDYMKSVSDTVVSSKGWESKDRNVSTRAKATEPVEYTPEKSTPHTASSGEKHGGFGKSFGTTDEAVSTIETQPTETEEVKTKPEEVKSESKTSDKKGTQNAKDFVRKNKTINQMSLLSTLLTWKEKGELDGAYEVLKEAIANGSLVIQNGAFYIDKSESPLEILDSIYKQVQ